MGTARDFWRLLASGYAGVCPRPAVRMGLTYAKTAPGAATRKRSLLRRCRAAWRRYGRASKATGWGPTVRPMALERSGTIRRLAARIPSPHGQILATPRQRYLSFRQD